MNGGRDQKRMKKKVLVGSDSQSIRESVRVILDDQFLFFSSSFSQDLKQIVEREGIDLVILEIGYLNEKNISLLNDLFSSFSDLQFVLLVENYDAEEWNGILDRESIAIVKIPAQILDLRDRVEGILKSTNLKRVRKKIIDETECSDRYLIEENRAKFSTEVIKLLDKAITHETPVLIQGEKGTGRGLAARIIHCNGLRKKKQFLHLVCRDLTLSDFIKTLIEKRDKYSPKKSSYGTIYFDEIGDLCQKTQRMIAELIEQGGIRAESGEFVETDFRIIASTSTGLFKKMKDGNFDQKLFYKISTLPIHIEPLRERREEIPLIVEAILKEEVMKLTLSKKSFFPEAMESLKDYFWPGNLTELESVVIRSALLASNEIISPEEISYYFGRVSKDSKKHREVLADTEYPPSEGFEEGREKERKADEGNEDLIMELAHEIKNPLVAIKTFANLLPTQFDDPEFRSNFYKVMNEDIDRIDSLVESVLEYQRVLALQPEAKSLPEVLSSVIQSLEKEFNNNRILVSKDFDQNLSNIQIENNKISFALKNVILRLIKEVGEDSELRFLARVKSLTPVNSAGNFSTEGIEVVISAMDTRNKEKEELFFINEKHFGVKGIEIFLAEQLIKSNSGKISINTIDNSGIEVIILIPEIKKL